MVRSAVIIAGNIGVFIAMMEAHIKAAGAVHNLAVFAHFLAIEREHFVGRIVAFIFQRDHLQAKQRTGYIHVGAVVAIIVVIFGHAGAGVGRETGILYVRSVFLHAK